MGGIIEISSDEESEEQEPIARPPLIVTDPPSVPTFRPAKVEPSVQAEKPRNAAANVFSWGDPLPPPDAARRIQAEGRRGGPAPLVSCKIESDGGTTAAPIPPSQPILLSARTGVDVQERAAAPIAPPLPGFQSERQIDADEQQRTALRPPSGGDPRVCNGTTMQSSAGWPSSSNGASRQGSPKGPAVQKASNVGVSAPPPATTTTTTTDDVCRHFWRAGDYEAQHTTVKSSGGPIDHVRVHPKFLHSNATSHKWALGAVAELLDNAVDEIQNGATFVKVDKIVNPRDGSPALLVHDDGGGMDPACMRQCMSLGYSGKNTNNTIGQYGNGFKTSTMRLGADVVVISRSRKGSVATQSVGLLSYTYLRKTGMEDVVVPMIDYELSPPAVGSGGVGRPSKMLRGTVEDWLSNMSTITQWSPFSSEEELLEQCNSLGSHGTKVIIYNLWFNDDGVLELDFNVDATDIQLRGGMKVEKSKPSQHQLAQNHIANQYHHSLRVYISILYMKRQNDFQIFLRGRLVEHHSLEKDLKFSEQIVYKPLIANRRDARETTVVTTIGFTKEAPLVNVHGFNVYHKNRLIIPFWKVWQDNSSRGRGVVGVLEANFVEPAHDKQDFERTAVLVRLEARLKQMTVEYWNLHCHLIGYQPHSKAGRARRPAAPAAAAAAAATPVDYNRPVEGMAAADGPSNSIASSSMAAEDSGREDSAVPRRPMSADGGYANGARVKAEPVDDTGPEEMQRLKRQKVAGEPLDVRPLRETSGPSNGALVVHPSHNDVLMIDLIHENALLRTKYTEVEQERTRLTERVTELEKELKELYAKSSLPQSTDRNGSHVSKVPLPDASNSID